MGKAIEFDNVTIRKSDTVLLKNLNMVINTGDRYAFLGPNGIGKTLLLELLSLGCSNELCTRYKGLVVEGKITDKDGQDLLDPCTRKKIAYVTQNEDFYRGSTVYDEAESACNAIGIELDEEKFDYYLHEFKISDKKNVKIKNNVSTGEGKIIHLIFGLLKLEACNIMLLDEPLNHLSFQNSKVFNRLMKEEIQKNPSLTVIMVTHCRAMDFVKQALVYVSETKGLTVKEYTAYDCFNTMF